MNNSRTADKFVVRLPEGLRSRIANLAFRNRRSMNSEIVTRLESYLDTKNELDSQKQLVRVLLDRIEHLEKQGNARP